MPLPIGKFVCGLRPRARDHAAACPRPRGRSTRARRARRARARPFHTSPRRVRLHTSPPPSPPPPSPPPSPPSRAQRWWRRSSQPSPPRAAPRRPPTTRTTAPPTRASRRSSTPTRHATAAAAAGAATAIGSIWSGSPFCTVPADASPWTVWFRSTRRFLSHSVSGFGLVYPRHSPSRLHQRHHPGTPSGSWQGRRSSLDSTGRAPA